MITIKCKDNYIPERAYIYSVIFNEFLGIEYNVCYDDSLQETVILYDGCRYVEISDCFFSMPTEWYLTPKSLPKIPLSRVILSGGVLADRLAGAELPVIYGKHLKNGNYIKVADDCINLGIDIFGSSFFMLTRYEEAVNPRYDKSDFDHYVSAYSLAGQEGFLERPIVNEYLELLWWAINTLWPEMKRKKRFFRVIPTHDVDRPSVFLGFGKRPHFQRFAGDLIVRKDVGLFLHRWRVVFDILRKGYQGEWKHTFDYIMDISERNGFISTFFFMNSLGLSEFDGNYNIFHKDILSVIKHIKQRGHEIGVHPSYASFEDSDIILDNASCFRRVLEGFGFDTNFGGRQHYLRWEPGVSWQKYEDAGMTFDTTLSFADHIGFRCGTCYEYPVFNLFTREALRLREKPLLVMDCSALNYMGLDYYSALNRILKIKKLCKKYQGDFVLLWHNDMFIIEKMNRLYNSILEG